MSRIGKKPIQVPAGVTVSVATGSVKVKGPKGELTMPVRPEIAVAYDDAAKEVNFALAKGVTNETPGAKAFWGTTRALVRNMIDGVTKGYERNMHVVGTGWTASVSSGQLKLVAGYANPLFMTIPTGITVTVDKAQGDVTPVKVVGIDRQAVGQFASAMRALRKPEPYNGKGIKYAEEIIKRKQGKQTA